MIRVPRGGGGSVVATGGVGRNVQVDIGGDLVRVADKADH